MPRHATRSGHWLSDTAVPHRYVQGAVVGVIQPEWLLELVRACQLLGESNRRPQPTHVALGPHKEATLVSFSAATMDRPNVPSSSRQDSTGL